MARRKKESDPAQKDLRDVAVQLRTAPCVPALREAVRKWRDEVIRRLHEKTSLTAQLDFSATPRFQKGAIFPWTIFDYPLKQAIVDNEGTHWLLETKGQQTEDVSHKDHAAEMWCEKATALTGIKWRYLKVMQKEFDRLQPDSLSDLLVIH